MEKKRKKETENVDGPFSHERTFEIHSDHELKRLKEEYGNELIVTYGNSGSLPKATVKQTGGSKKISTGTVYQDPASKEMIHINRKNKARPVTKVNNKVKSQEFSMYGYKLAEDPDTKRKVMVKLGIYKTSRVAG